MDAEQQLAIHTWQGGRLVGQRRRGRLARRQPVATPAAPLRLLLLLLQVRWEPHIPCRRRKGCNTHKEKQQGAALM